MSLKLFYPVLYHLANHFPVYFYFQVTFSGFIRAMNYVSTQYPFGAEATKLRWML